MPLEKLFRRYIVEPIPKGVTNIQIDGGMYMTGGLLMIMFDEDPAVFSTILRTNHFKPIDEKDREGCDKNYFWGCPSLDNAEYFEDASRDGTIVEYAIKTNQSKTKVYYAFSRD